MSTQQETSIHDFDFGLICDYFSSLRRQGPGSRESTLRAIGFLPRLTEGAQVADLGCGTGSSALLLARYTDAHVTALDLFPQFVENVRRQAAVEGLSDRVTAVVGSMDELPFAERSMDVIWSEGAIYNIGFRRGMELWHKYLKPGGIVAVTEATWLTDRRPQTIEQFWREAYAEIDTVPHKVQAMQDAGYIPVATFLLPENCWTEEFYLPQREAQRIFLERHRGNTTAEGLVANLRHEAEMYERYKPYYGYVFYIGRKAENIRG